MTRMLQSLAAMFIFVRAAALLAALGFAGSLTATTPAQAFLASCTFTITGVSFGTNLNAFVGSTIDTTGNLRINCSSLAAVPGITVCAYFGQGSGGVSGGNRIALNGVKQLPFQLYKDAARTQVWGNDSYGDGPNKVFLSGISLLGPPVSLDVPIYARAFMSGAVAPGTYTSTIDASYIFDGLVLLSPCSIGILPGTGSGSFNVTGSVASSCLIAATDMNFGTTGSIAAAIDATSTVNITCNVSAAYTVGLSNGNNSLATQRRMASGVNRVNYGLFLDNGRSQPWTTLAGQLASGTGTGIAQPLTVYGRVPVQTTPPPGTYTDVIVATVTY